MKIPEGIIIRTSLFEVAETTNRLVRYIKEHGITLYARINQQEELWKNNIHISELEFILFGNPKFGGPLMVANPLSALDLPLKIIVWKDKLSETNIAYNDMGYLSRRFHLDPKLTAHLDLDLLITEALN